MTETEIRIYNCIILGKFPRIIQRNSLYKITEIKIKIPLEDFWYEPKKRKEGRFDAKKNVETAYDIRCAIFDRSIRSKTRASGTRIPGYLRNPTKYTDRIRSDLFSLPLEILFGRARWLPGENKHFSTLFRPLKRVERARAPNSCTRVDARVK